MSEELREAIAEIVAVHTPDLIREGPNGEDDGQHLYCVEDGVLPIDASGLQYGPLHVADALLSGPLAPLLAAQAAVERAEALAAEWDTRHSGWCCTVDCPERDGRHPDPTDPVRLEELVGMWGDNPPPLIEHRTIPCPGTCSCQVGPYIAGIRSALGGTP